MGATGSGSTATGSDWDSTATGSGSMTGSGSGSTAGSGSGSMTISGVGSCSTAGAPRLTDNVTLVPQPDCLSCTMPLAPSLSHSTFVSGSTLVIRISPSPDR